MQKYNFLKCQKLLKPHSKENFHLFMNLVKLLLQTDCLESTTLMIMKHFLQNDLHINRAMK